MPISESIKPRFIIYLSYALWSFPLSYILVLTTFYNLKMSQMLWMIFTAPYILHSLLAVWTGWALFRLRPYAWHLFVLHTILAIAEQFYVAIVISDRNAIEIPVALAVMSFIGILIFLKKELRVPYFSPKIAWWESDPRYKISIPVNMTNSDHLYHGEIMDISANGCFIKSKAPLKVDQVINLKFKLFDHEFHSHGRVVWRTNMGVTHPQGVGVKFTDLDRNEQIMLKDTVKKLRSLSIKYRRMRAEEKASSVEKKVLSLLSQDRKSS